jgi:hypothetical protein
MPEMILPGVYIDVNAEGLISPGQITTGNIGIIGTASKGQIGVPSQPIGSFAEAKQIYGAYDAWIDGQSNELTLVRALELAYNQGATTVFAVRIADSTAAKASAPLNSQSGLDVTLNATTEGTWGNNLAYNVSSADQDAIVSKEVVDVSGTSFKLKRSQVVQNARNLILFNHRPLIISYDDGTKTPTPPASGGVLVKLADGTLTFPTAETPAANKGDKVTATYAVSKNNAVKVTLRLKQAVQTAVQTFTVVDGDDLIQKINDPLTGSTWVQFPAGTTAANTGELPTKSNPPDAYTVFSGGQNGAAVTAADYVSNLDLLLDQDVQIVVAAGQNNNDLGNALDAHCQNASTDVYQSERIALVGSALLGISGTISSITNHSLDSDRVIFVAPGIQAIDSTAPPPGNVTLPGSYAAAAVAGLLSSFEPHTSLTNKVLPVSGLEQQFNRADLTELLLARVLALESHLGFHIVRGITTSTNTAWQQITTRRIVDYAKRGVRSSADPYIGLLNNDQVRGALRATINSFLTDMLNDGMLVGYDLDVTATRAQQIQGIVEVTMTLQPVFSIDYIQVTMYLQ